MGDGNQESKPLYPLSINGGPMTRARAKRMKEALNWLVRDIWAKSLAQHDLYTFEGTSKLQNIIQAQEQAQEHQS